MRGSKGLAVGTQQGMEFCNMPESCYNEKYLAWSSGEGGAEFPSWT